MRRSRLAPLLVSLATLLLLAVVLAVAEAAVRGLAPETCAAIRREGEQAEHLASLLEPCLGPGARIVRRLQGHGGPEELRIAVIGESSAGLLGDRLAAVAAAAPVCDRPTEVLACGQWQGSIEYVQTRLDEVLTYHPDVVVLVFGHNTRFRFPGRRTSLWARALVDHSCALGALLPRGEDVAAGPLASIDERLPQLAALLAYAAEATAAQHVKLIVATMASNEWLMPSQPFGAADEPLATARALEAAGRRDAAIDLLRVAADRPGASAAVHFQLGAWLAADGDTTGARRELQRAIDLDTSGFRADGRVNETIRRLARERGFIVRDTEAALVARGAGVAPGWETFRDNCHLDAQAVSEEATAVLALARAAVGLPSVEAACRQRDRLASLRGIVSSAEPTGAGRWVASLSYAVPQWLAADPEDAARDLHAFLDSPELATLGPGVRAEFVAAVAEGFARAERWPEALQLAARATAQPGASGLAWVARARLHLRHGEVTEARAVLDQAPLDTASRAEAAALRSVLEEASERTGAVARP